MLTKPEIESFSDEELDSLKELLEEEFRRRALPQTAQKQILARMNRRDLRCPTCKSKLQKDGKRKDGVQVYFCPICGKHYSDKTGSSLSASKLKTKKIREIIILVMLGCPDWVIAVLAKISDKTAQFWRDRCLDAADAWADEGKLSGKVYLDEMLFSPSRAEAYRTKLRLLNNCCSVIRYSFESHRGIKTEKLESHANLFLYRWIHERKDEFETTVEYLFNRVCEAKKSHLFADSFKKTAVW